MRFDDFLYYEDLKENKKWIKIVNRFIFKTRKNTIYLELSYSIYVL